MFVFLLSRFSSVDAVHGSDAEGEDDSEGVWKHGQLLRVLRRPLQQENTG